MAPSLPPGPIYLVKAIVKLSVPFSVVFLAQHFQSDILPSHAWKWAYILTLPIVVALQNVVKYVKEEVEVRKLGARRVPMVPTYLPFGLDALYQLGSKFVNGYICACSL